ncbi:uncharacterized protein PRCAT00005774001 [Priceomyces carsonii]|uniref:uncharacterized protein n=1 Tax=Priceomyces carsonii TaxID=28549 RepID=UPI002ED8BABE|nr:unnamed protein product [Priceomyces carsonii]
MNKGMRNVKYVIEVAKSCNIYLYRRVIELRMKDWKTLVTSQWFFIGMQILVNLVQYLLSYIYSQPYGTRCVAGILIILGDILMIVFLIVERVNRKRNMEKSRLLKLVATLRRMIWFLFMVLIVYKVISLGLGTIKDPLNLGKEAARVVNLDLAQRLAIMAFTIISIFFDFAALTVLWSFKISFASLVFGFSFLFDFVLGILEIQLTAIQIANVPHEGFHIKAFYLFVGAFTIAGALLGFSIMMTMTPFNRFSPIFRRLVLFLDLCFVILTLLTAVAFGTAVYMLQESGIELTRAIPIMFGACMFINMAAIWSSRKLWVRFARELIAEEIDLSSLKPYQRAAYAKLISSNSRSNAGVSGEEILSLMDAYSVSKLDNLRCVVLRIYDPRKSGSISSPDERNRLFEKYQAVDYNEKFFFDEAKEDLSVEILDTLKPMSKNQRKRLLKKANAKKKVVEFPLNSVTSDAEFEDEMKFYSDLKSTEALVLFSIVDSYDVTSSIPGRLGKIMSRYFGANSFSKFLCIRVGLLAFHWPFRHSIFYCSSTKNLGLRNALIFKAIAKYNNRQKRKCTIIIDPMYSCPATDNSINYSSWVEVSLPPTNIIDLRPHKKESPLEFFKSIKYRVQSDAFLNAGGVVFEKKEYSKSSCSTALDLWSNIAVSRMEHGCNGYFANPNLDFFETLVSYDNEMSKRSLLFLEIDGEAIASCVLFRLGETITSDLQGLNYEKGRRHKAYFVMMETVVKIAMKEGKSFVDFGPTTDASKHSIGCQSVHLTGALYTSLPFVSGIINFVAKKIKI